MKLEKVQDWRDELNKHIEANRDKPHSWVDHYCGGWVSSCLLVTTGVDPLAGKLRPFKTAKGAQAALKRAGYDTPEAMAEALLGPMKPAAFARAGDVVCADLTALGVAGEERQIGLSLGICNGSVCYFVGEAGLVTLSTLSMVGAFDG